MAKRRRGKRVLPSVPIAPRRRGLENWGYDITSDTPKDGPLQVKLADPNKRKNYSAASTESTTFSIFQDVLEDAYEYGIDAEDIKYSTRWFYDTIRKNKNYNSGDPKDILRARRRFKTRLTYGKLYHFVYDAKWQDKLPYWDKFPLTFPVSPVRTKSGSGFFGLNLHYLRPNQRVALMGKLYDLEMTGRYDHKAKLQLSYKILEAASHMEEFRPCFKHYLYGYVRSPFVELHYPEWVIAAALPTQKFDSKRKKGVTDEKVWRDSQKRIRQGYNSM